MDPREENCLKRQLLYAAVEAYHPRPPFYGPRPQWTQRPIGVNGPPIDFALVGRLAKGIVVAFRGTQPPLDLKPDLKTIGVSGIPGLIVVQDWLNGFKALPASDVAIGGAALAGEVHSGFAGSLGGLWDGVAAEVIRLRAGDPAPRLYFTGHSKGGALANLAAACARQVWPDMVVKAVTFGAPRVGDATFAGAYAAAGIECHRYEAAKDLVPTFTPDRTPVGAPHGVASVAFSLPQVRFDHFRLVIVPDVRWAIPDVIAAHLPYPGFPYGSHAYRADGGPDWS